MKHAIAALALALVHVVAPAFAQEVVTPCKAPEAPPTPATIQMPPKPVDPPCGDRCTRKQINDFNAQVDAYNRALGPANVTLGEYVLALNGYQLSVTKYANCEINRVNALVK